MRLAFVSELSRQRAEANRKVAGPRLPVFAGHPPARCQMNANPMQARFDRNCNSICERRRDALYIITRSIIRLFGKPQHTTIHYCGV